MALHFDYQIPEEEFVSGQVLVVRWLMHKATLSGVSWTALGILLVVVACVGSVGITSLFLGIFGLWWIYAGIMRMFPALYLRRKYLKSGVVGKTYHADVGEDGFEVVADLQSWRVKWPGVITKDENDRVFMFYAANTVFIFGKQYLTEDQQRELRSLGGLGPR